MVDLLECECGNVFLESWGYTCGACGLREGVDFAGHDARVRFANDLLDDALRKLQAVEGNGHGDSLELTTLRGRLELLGGVLDDMLAVQDRAALAGQRQEPSDER